MINNMMSQNKELLNQSDPVGPSGMPGPIVNVEVTRREIFQEIIRCNREIDAVREKFDTYKLILWIILIVLIISFSMLGYIFSASY